MVQAWGHAHAHLANRAKKDGSEIGLLLRQIVTEDIFSKVANLAPLEGLQWIGSPSQVTDVCGARRSSGTHSLSFLRDFEFLIPATNIEGSEATEASLFNNLAGAKLKPIFGYAGGSEMNIALSRQEVQGRCAISLEAIKSSYPELADRSNFDPFIRFSMKRHADLLDVPSILEFAANDNDRAAVTLQLLPQLFGYPFAAPPGLSREALWTLRSAFGDTMNDPEFRRDAERQRLSVDPQPGDLLQRLYQIRLNSLPEVLNRAKELAVRK